jgi:hypothetical protein
VPPPTPPTGYTTTGDCVLPADAYLYSVITSGDATIGAHNMYKGLAIGGTLYDGTPNEDGTVDQSTSYVHVLDPRHRFNFNGGIVTGGEAVSVVTALMAQFEYLTTTAQSSSSSSSDSQKVFVLTKGGTYNTYDFRPGGQGEDNGNTVVIFDTSEDVYLTKTSDGRQFGPTVIAPFATVYVYGEAGYVDGLIVARKFVTTGDQQGALQLHGDTYYGPFVCQKKYFRY